MSFVWEFFQVSSVDETHAICVLCNSKIKRGGTPKTYSTSPLHKHLSAKHFVAYTAAKRKSSEQAGSSSSSPSAPAPKQVKLAAMKQASMDNFKPIKVWNINDAGATKIHTKIMNMIAMDNQPFSVVNDQGFIELLAHLEPRYLIPSSKYFNEVMLPDVYNRLKCSIAESLNEASFLSCTTDIWTNSNSNTSFLSLTAHWLKENFSFEHYVLHCKEIEGRHTGLNICENIKAMLSNWSINLDRVHLVVRDNAYNMRLGMSLLNTNSLPCFIHTLQLVIKDSLFEDVDIKLMLAKARKICGHFSHSSTACEKFKSIQMELDSSVTKESALLLVQDVPTRWNSTFLMLRRLDRLKVSVQQYVANNLADLMITSREWKLVSDILVLLKPFFMVTETCSKRDALLSSLIPHSRALITFLRHQTAQASDQTSSSIVFLARKLKEACEKRLYSTTSSYNLYDNNLLLVTTAVDPRYRLSVFPTEIKEKVETLLLTELKNHNRDLARIRGDSSPSKTVSHDDQQQTGNSGEESSTEFDPNNFFSFYSFSQQATPQVQHITGPKNDELQAEIRLYLAVPNLNSLANESEVFSWWNANKSQYPHMASFAQRLLCAPPSSVPSERLFSEAGNLYEQKRNRLLPKTGEKLLFLHHNLKR